MFNKLKQFKDMASMAKKAQELQSMLSQEKVTGSAQSDKITVTINGNFGCEGVHIDASLLTTDNQHKLEDGVKEAMADAIKKIQGVMAAKMKSQMGDMDFSKLMGGEQQQ